MPHKDVAGFREQCDQIRKFRLQHAGDLPKRKSVDVQESRLARVLSKLRMREQGDIGAGMHPCERQLSPDDAVYLRKMLDEPCEAHASDPSDFAASGALNGSSRASRGEDGAAPAGKVRRLSTIGRKIGNECDPSDLTASSQVVFTSLARKIGEDVLAWQALWGCQRIPNRRSQDEYEKKLGKRFEDVLRRRYCAIGDRPCQQKLSADVVHFINEIPGVPPYACSVNNGNKGNTLDKSLSTEITNSIARADVIREVEKSVKRRRRRKGQTTGAGSTGAELGPKEAKQVVAKSIKDIWATEVAAGNKFFECIKRSKNGRQLRDQFKNLVAGDLFVVVGKGQKLRIFAVAEVSQTREKDVQEKSVLYSKLPSALHSELDNYLGDSTFDYVPFSRVWDLRGEDLSVQKMSARIGAASYGLLWQYGLVNICAEKEAHTRLLELLAKFPCRLNESSLGPKVQSATACETDGDRVIFETTITQTDQRRHEHLINYKESLRSLFSCQDYAGAAALKTKILADAEAEGYDIAAIRERMTAAKCEIMEEKLTRKKRRYDEQ